MVAWTTEYYSLVVESMRRSGCRDDDGMLCHISPARSGCINVFGAVEGELAQLGPTGYRPLHISAQNSWLCPQGRSDWRVVTGFGRGLQQARELLSVA